MLSDTLAHGSGKHSEGTPLVKGEGSDKHCKGKSIIVVLLLLASIILLYMLFNKTNLDVHTHGSMKNVEDEGMSTVVYVYQKYVYTIEC